jgi:hypothetical protein
MLIRRLEEDMREGMRLGRHVVHDPRSKDFAAEETSKALVSVRHLSLGLPLNQGQIGSCTGNAAAGDLNTAPFYVRGKRYTERDAKAFYHDETEQHSENGVYPPADPGGSGLWVAQVLKGFGLIAAYKHAFSFKAVCTALQTQPVIWGTNWLTGMDTPDAEGLIRFTGTSRGGHELMLDAIDVDARTVDGFNSWGKSWGAGGRFAIGWSDFEKSMADQGDVTIFVAS